VLSQEVVNFHAHTPQKSRSVMSENSFQPTNLYRSVYQLEESGSRLDPTRQSWIGKYFIPQGYEPANPQKNNYVYEREVAKHVRPWTFTVLFIGRPGAPKYMANSTGIDTISKPDANYHPNRTNIYVDDNDVIRKVEFH
jgi:hypothetical protein